MTDIAKWKENILTGPRRVAMPIMTHPGIEMIGASVREAVTDETVQQEAVCELCQRFPTAAATMIMDLSVEAEAFGAEIQFQDRDVPVVISRRVTTDKDIGELPIPSLQSGRIPHFLKAAGLIQKKITDRPVFASCIGPFSLAGRLFGMTEIMMSLMLEPGTIHLVLEKCTRFLADYIKAYQREGMPGIVMAEPAAGMLSPAMCHEFSSAYIARLIKDIQGQDFIFILHNCGNTNKLLGSIQGTGAAALHFGKPCDLGSALEFIDSNRLVMGNLDPAEIFKMATPREVRRQTTILLEKTYNYLNFIISSGCDIPPHTPLPNLEAFFEALEKHNQDRRRE